MLEGVKMSSYSVYTRMNDMYGMTARKDTQLALEAFWVSEYALVSPRFASSPSSDLVEKGRKINEQSCAIRITSYNVCYTKLLRMFAFIISLGIVVDDAIIAGENIYEYRQRGMSYIDAAIKGGHDVAVPIAFSILTNIAAFMPLYFVPGMMGKVWKA